MLVSIDVPATRLPEVVATAHSTSAGIIDVSQSQCTLFLAADPRRIDDLLAALGGFTTRDLVLSAPLRTRTLVRRHRPEPGRS
ncbi:hypothetical protein [Prauserella muralis]|uniref:hypothetical protein n=1 Tax=Prauserella muralis TaxID=588067 RepID=UPI0011BDA201|nr:hypothetical protein [Prauserella muralis]